MTRQNRNSAFAGISILAAILACSVLVPTETPAPSSPPANTIQIPDTGGLPTEALIQHQLIPVSLPANRSGHAGDYDSSVTAPAKKSAGGDRFTFERFERPFNANTMDIYFANLDIVDTLVYQDDAWIFGIIQVKHRAAGNSSPYRFAMQLDTDLDGKGDWLIMASNTDSSDWTVKGVQVFQDANNNVGTLTPMFTDIGASTDGFETMIFDQGKGNDPDVAWIRVSPQDLNTIEMAVERSAIENPLKYLINMWAGHASLDPVLFDYSDHFTHEQAGAADPSLEFFYPIKAVYELDNSCRMAVGFQPTGNEPGLCTTIDSASPGDSACTTTSNDLSKCFKEGGVWNYETCTCDLPSPP